MSFDIRVRYQKLKSPDGREKVNVEINGLIYDGLVHEKDGLVHVFIPEINKTFVMGDTK